MPFFQEKTKKNIYILITGLFIFTQVFGGLFLYAKPAGAQMPVTEATLDQAAIQEQIDRVAAKRVEELQGTWWMGLVSAVMNAVGYFANKIAYDAAVAVASLGSGQTPAFFTQDWGSYLTDTALNSAGEFIGSISESYGDELGTAGLGNLCMPPDPQLRLNIGLSLGDSVSPNGPRPRCEWSNIVEQWDTFITEASTPEVLSRVSLQFRPTSGSGLGAWIQARGQMQEGMEKKTKTASEERKEGQGFKSVGDLITRNIKTPSTVVKDSITKQIDPKSASEKDIEGAGSQASSAGALVGQNALSMLGSIASTFVNTLASKLMNRVMGGLFSLKDIGKLFPKKSGLENPEFAGLGGRAVAEATFADFLAPRIQEAGKYDPLVEMMTCPSGINKMPENCVLDSKFAQAITQATMGDPLTVKNAIEKNLLDGKWPLISADDPRHNDSRCFQKGYCYSNLVKLRKYRILPIGWEMAASLATDVRTGTILETVINNFNNCNDEGEADIEHPWCHLIDPNWILKVPAHQCNARVYGAISIEGARMETCVDTPSCIAEGDDGSCESGWGYCTREKNIWRLPGDPCDEQFDSCRALRTRNEEIKSYLMSTVDYGPPCSADDVGCKWYSKSQTKVGEEYKWQDRPVIAEPENKTDRIYFNKNIAQCNEEGCSEFYKTSKETNLNLVANSSFEEAEDLDNDSSDKEAKYWVGDNDVFSPTAKDGGSSLALGGEVTQEISVGKPLVGRTFVLSLYARNADCSVGAGSRAVLKVGGVEVRTLDITETTNDRWSRKKTDGIYFGAGDLGADEENVTVRIAGNNCLIDAIQLEEANGATPYHNGWTELGDAVNLKKAPEYYNCYNYNNDGTVKTTDDAAQCSNFIGACQENEAGCDRYTPKDGDPPVPGITTFPNDYCPQECVGYQTFKQLETNFEEEKYPVFFIPKTAEKCTASEAGCDEFTSLETEQVENYSYARQCQKPDPRNNPATFYTWEGSDTKGYQLKTWNLKRSYREVWYADGPSYGPCTHLRPDGSGICGDEGEEGSCEEADTAIGSASYNPDCRIFYDSTGHRYYALYSKTIVITDDCREYRKTYSDRDSCLNFGGSWNAERNDCQYNIYPAESKRCSSVGCRAYRGNAGANVRNIFQNNFEGGAEEWAGGSVSSEAVDNGGHSLKINSGAIAAKSVAGKIKKDGIYLVSFWAKTEAAGGRANFQFNDGGGVLRLGAPLSQELTLNWQQYTIGPIEVTWNPTEDTDIIEGDKLQVNAAGANIYLDNILFKQVIDRIYLVKDSWNTPATCDMTQFGGYLPQAMLGCEEYRDRDNRQHFLKSFTSLCREEAIGCQKLVDTKNSQSPYGAVYNGVCTRPGAACDDVAGCSCEVDDARVCTMPRGQTSCRYNSVGVISDAGNRAADTVEIKADSYAYLVVDKSKTCNPANIGCEAFGAPKLDSMGSIICTMPDGADAGSDPDTCDVSCELACRDPRGCECRMASGKTCTVENGKDSCTVADGCECKRDGTKMCTVKDGDRSCTGEFESVNFLNNPKFYEGQSKILCEASYDSCEEYTGSDGATFYFRDPGKRTCEWKDDITYRGEKRSGWFRKDNDGADVPCYEDYTMAGVFGIWKNADSDWEGRVGNCPKDQNMCTKFVDPTSTSGENPKGEPYFYIKNDKLTDREGECKGQVSLQQGCVLFDDTSNLNKYYNAGVSYNKSETGGESISPGEKVNPIDCSSRENEEICTVCDSDLDGEDDDLCGNDTNVIYKVRKDRVCGEWLSCETSNTVWDSFTNKKREVCTSLGLCNKVAEGSDVAICGKWIDDDAENKNPQILDLQKYTSRAVGWKGSDYSGYSIPNQFQAYKLSQVNLGDPRVTNPISAEGEWRLGLVEEERCYGEGAGDLGRNRVERRDCEEEDDVDNCYRRDRDCGPREEDGTCTLRNGTECRVMNAGDRVVRRGKCWNKKCIYDPEGRPIDGFPRFAEYKPLEKESGFAPLCRAYPEKNSPFPRSVAYNEDGSSAIKQGFNNAQICEEQGVCSAGDKIGEFCSSDGGCPVGDDGAAPCVNIQNACDCSYSKMTFGGTAKYYHKENDSVSNSICVGGNKAGASCSLDVCPGDPPPEGEPAGDSPCACGWTGKASTGVCTAKDKVETTLGLKGYCLEKDSTTFINGSPDENVCLTWLPIDQLSGSVDIYNQFVNAGYAPGVKGQICLETELYVRPRPIWGCVNATGALNLISDGACEYEETYDGPGRDATDYWEGDYYCRWNRGDNCIPGYPASEDCVRCPTGWTYIEAGCAPKDKSRYCGSLYGSLDGCIYYCIPPGPLVNNMGTTADLEDDESIESGPLDGVASVCFPDRLLSDTGEGEGRNGYFLEKDGSDFLAPAGGRMDIRASRTSPALYCEADYFIKKDDYDRIIADSTDRRVYYHFSDTWGRVNNSTLKKAKPKMFPVCGKIIGVAESNDVSRAWTDRLYQNTESCVEGICVTGSLRSGSPCRAHADCNIVISAIPSDPESADIPSLNYVYASALSPFGYAAIDSTTEVRGGGQGFPWGVSYCTNDIEMKMPTARPDLQCEDPAPWRKVSTDNAPRPYLNFSYIKRTACSGDNADKTCNPGSIDCEIECFKRCDEDLDCPGGRCLPSDLDDERIPLMRDFMTLTEQALCPDMASDNEENRVRYCHNDDTGANTLPLDTTGPRGPCSSVCEMDDEGIAIGRCTNNGESCRVVEDCYSSLCVLPGRTADDSRTQRWLTRSELAWEEWAGGGTGYCSGITEDVETGPLHEGSEQYNRGKTRIAELFAESFKIYEWSPKILPQLSEEEPIAEPETDRGFYKEKDDIEDDLLTTDTFSTWNITETGDPITGETPSQPHVAPLKLPCVNDKCSPLSGPEGYISGITVNDKSSGTLISRSGELRADIKFFAWADKNQMPLKKVCVDFGNEKESSDCSTLIPINFYKNHWGYKSDGSPNCDNTSDFGDFGHSKQACTGDYFSYSTIYTCPVNGGTLARCPDATTTNCYAAVCPDTTVRGRGCCVFYPKVHVLDNWGWCNGDCPGPPGGAGSGCYDKGWDDEMNECLLDSSINLKNPWTPTNVKIIVVPR